MSPLRKEETMLTALLRMALWPETEAECGPFGGATAADWQRTVRLAVTQGVQAVAFDGMLRLTEALQPPREVRLPWAVNTELIESHNRRYRGVAASLAAFYARHGIRMILIKGPGLAELYPVPAHRESGDLDIWLHGRCDEGNRLITEQGIAVDWSSPKHACFRYEGIPVENHRTFLNVGRFAIDRPLEQALRAALAAQPEELRMEGTEIMLPPPAFNAVFLARHMATHLPGGIALRHLCDWMCFLRDAHGRYDTGEFTQLMKRAGLTTVTGGLTALCTTQLGMPVRFSPFGPPDGDTAATAAQLLEWILRPRYGTPPAGRTPAAIIGFKLRRLAAERKRYNMVYGGGFALRIGKSIVSHIVHPATILRLK